MPFIGKFEELNLNDLPAKPKIWAKGKILIKLKENFWLSGGLSQFLKINDKVKIYAPYMGNILNKAKQFGKLHAIICGYEK